MAWWINDEHITDLHCGVLYWTSQNLLQKMFFLLQRIILLAVTEWKAYSIVGLVSVCLCHLGGTLAWVLHCFLPVYISALAMYIHPCMLALLDYFRHKLWTARWSAVASRLWAAVSLYMWAHPNSQWFCGNIFCSWLPEKTRTAFTQGPTDCIMTF